MQDLKQRTVKSLNCAFGVSTAQSEHQFERVVNRRKLYVPGETQKEFEHFVQQENDPLLSQCGQDLLTVAGALSEQFHAPAGHLERHWRRLTQTAEDLALYSLAFEERRAQHRSLDVAWAPRHLKKYLKALLEATFKFADLTLAICPSPATVHIVGPRYQLGHLLHNGVH